MWVEWQWLHLCTNHFWPTSSPTGDRIRSKVELIRYLGPSCDLTLFDFKQGILCYPAPKVLHNVGYPDARGTEPPKTYPLTYILPALAPTSRPNPWLSPAGSGRSLRSLLKLENVRLDPRGLRSERRPQGLKPRLMLTQPQLRSLHLGECWPKVSQMGEGCGSGYTQGPTLMFPIPGTVRIVESASQGMVPEGSGSRHCARTAEVSGP